MKMKSIVSSFLIATTLATVLPAKKAEAGVVLFTAGTAMTFHAAYKSGHYKGSFTSSIGKPIMVAGVLLGASGVLLAATGIGPALIILAQDGAVTQSELEAALAEKYSFIQDNKVIADLATLIKSKAESTLAVDGKKMINLTETEVESALESTDLLETHTFEVQSMISDLK